MKSMSNLEIKKNFKFLLRKLSTFKHRIEHNIEQDRFLKVFP